MHPDACVCSDGALDLLDFRKGTRLSMGDCLSQCPAGAPRHWSTETEAGSRVTLGYPSSNEVCLLTMQCIREQDSFHILWCMEVDPTGTFVCGWMLDIYCWGGGGESKKHLMPPWCWCHSSVNLKNKTILPLHKENCRKDLRDIRNCLLRSQYGLLKCFVYMAFVLKLTWMHLGFPTSIIYIMSHFNTLYYFLSPWIHLNLLLQAYKNKKTGPSHTAKSSHLRDWTVRSVTFR